jgi:TetR/AcrR family transcriptional repressor of nem operon
METIGDFSLATSTQSKLLRQRLKAIFEEWRAPSASCIAEAQALDESGSSFSWEGAILRVKVERRPAARERFKGIVFETVFFKSNSRSRQ